MVKTNSLVFKKTLRDILKAKTSNVNGSEDTKGREEALYLNPNVPVGN